MVLLGMVAMLLALAAPVAMADDDCELLKRGDRPNRVDCDGERFTVPAFVNQAEIDETMTRRISSSLETTLETSTLMETRL